MAEIVCFPAVEPVTCGRLDSLPVHVWPDDARPGDLCSCGLSVLPPDPFLFELVPPSSFDDPQPVEPV